MRITFLILVYLFIYTLSVSARPYNFMLSDKNLSSSLVNSIYQDRDGMIWISTENGLNRYDGTKVTIYKHEEGNEHSLAHNYVRYMFEDAEGHFFVGNYMGLQLYRRETDDFSVLGAFEDGQPLRSSPSYITQTPSGEIYVSGNLACQVTVKDNVPLFLAPQWEGFPPSMTGELRLAKDGSLWCMKMNDAVYRVLPDGHKVERYADATPFKEAMYVQRDTEGDIYIQTTSNDLYKLNPENHTWHKLNATRISYANLKCIFRYDPTHILIGTDGNGIKMIDETTGEVSDYFVDLPALSSRYLKVHQIMRDQDGDLWMALFLKGVARIPMQESSFSYIGSQSVAANLIGSSSISSMLSDSKGQMWVGTDGEGLYRLHQGLTSSSHYATTTDGGTMPAIVQSLFEDSEGTIWVGSYNEGCGMISPRTGTFSFCNHLFLRKDVSATRIYGFAEDRQHRLWVASLGHGLFCYDLKTKRVLPELSFSDGVNLWETSLLVTSDNHLLIGTYDGVYELDLSQPLPTPRHIFDRSIVFSLYEDQQHRLWAGCSTGLINFSLISNELTLYTDNDGLAGNTAYSILGDANRTLWIGTNNGISHFLPDTKTFKNYSDADGLQGNEFSKNVSCTDLNGRLWFGGAYGITYFAPDQVRDLVAQRHARITGFYINNQAVSANTLSGGKPIVTGPLHLAREFQLAHANNSFSIELATVEFSDPDVVRYQYSMNGSDWMSLPQGSHLVSFSDLQPGSYHFSYKVTDGQSESLPEEVLIVIRPDWWESPLARLAYVLLALLIISSVAYFFYRQHKVRRDMLLQQHAHEIDEAKLRFFTNITHELRTPMTLIMSPLQKLMSTDSDPARQSAYKTMHRNARMLLQLANQLLDIRKIDNKQMKLVFCETDILAQLKELRDFFIPIAENKHIDFYYDHEGLDECRLWVDPSYFNKIVVNLLSNAFKYTHDHGHVALLVSKLAQQNVEYVQIAVSDDGVGIPPEDMEHIFERFYRTKSAHLSADGNGIGLHLTRSLVTLHHGIIKAENNPEGQGTTFTVLLPMGKDHLRQEEIATEVPAEVVADDSLTAPLPETPAQEEENRTSSRTKYRLLVVDDDDEIRSYLSRELSADFHVQECSDGQEALQQIFKQKPDLVISDVMMPTVDGFTLCQRIKQNISLNHIPVILLTAKADQESNIEGLESGADAYLAKPFYIEILRRMALNLVRTRTQLKNSFNGKQVQEDKLENIEMRSANDKLMDRIMRSVNRNIQNADYSIDELCQDVGISRVHLYRKLKELTNQSPRDFIRNIRLKQAERLLLRDAYSINEIAEAVGFSRANNFSSAFKELYGYPPLQWKAMQLEKGVKPDDETTEAENSQPES